ncbi:MAG: hypothetical protein Q8Q09_09540 [Deltaproteobacteria bacterium]|nr:hypothetical protein [Deltaproteobacteria bacterium]
MGMGFPASYQEDFMVPPTLHPNVIWQTLQMLGWAGAGTPDGLHFTGSVSMSFGSWGEKLTIVRVAPDRLTVRSECSMPTQVFDWGKNDKNVRQFYMALIAVSQGQPIPRL